MPLGVSGDSSTCSNAPTCLIQSCLTLRKSSFDLELSFGM